MRRVSGTPWNPAKVFSASGHSTAWTSTKTRLPLPRPNHSSANGSSAMAGKRVEHRCQGREQVAAELRRDRERRQPEGEEGTDRVALRENGEGDAHTLDQLAVRQSLGQGGNGRGEARQQEVIVLEAAPTLPRPQPGSRGSTPCAASPAARAAPPRGRARVTGASTKGGSTRQPPGG